MKQPDLGKKIAELRLAKGLTQGQLAEKCNISLRTIQRIEAAEVSPRSYTVKVIFECLDYGIYDSFGKFSYKLDRMAYRLKLWLEQLYRYVLDLFNLKTNTVKKITILSVPFLALCAFLAFSISSNAKAQSKQLILAKFEDARSASKFMRLFNTGQIDSLGMLYLENACIMPDFPSAIEGRANIIDYNKQLYEGGFRFSSIKSDFTLVNDFLAVERGSWAITLNSVPVSTGLSLTQWHYIDGEWLIENSMFKTDKISDPSFFD